jgi:hypothetical protein
MLMWEEVVKHRPGSMMQVSNSRSYESHEALSSAMENPGGAAGLAAPSPASVFRRLVARSVAEGTVSVSDSRFRHSPTPARTAATRPSPSPSTGRGGKEVGPELSGASGSPSPPAAGRTGPSEEGSAATAGLVAANFGERTRAPRWSPSSISMHGEHATCDTAAIGVLGEIRPVDCSAPRADGESERAASGSCLWYYQRQWRSRITVCERLERGEDRLQRVSLPRGQSQTRSLE